MGKSEKSAVGAEGGTFGKSEQGAFFSQEGPPKSGPKEGLARGGIYFLGSRQRPPGPPSNVLLPFSPMGNLIAILFTFAHKGMLLFSPFLSSLFCANRSECPPPWHVVLE